MTTRETTPELLTQGDTILGKDGQPWVLEAVDATTVTMVRGRKRYDVPKERLPARVPLVETAAEAQERAVALTQVRLGGAVVAKGQEDGSYDVPSHFPDVAALLGHLYLFHSGDAHRLPGNLSTLLLHHDQLHRDTPPAVVHRHQDSFHRDLAAGS